MAGWKVEPLASGNIALRTFSNKGGTVRMTNEMVFTPQMADKIAFALQSQAQQATLAQAGAQADKEFDALSDDDFEDEEEGNCN